MPKTFLKTLLITLTFVSLFGFLAIENNVFAAPDVTQTAQELAGTSTPIDIFRILTKIVKYTYTTFFFVAIFFIIIAAFTYLTAGDDTAKISSAHKQIFWAVIAIAIALVSMGAAQIIQSFITTP